MMKLKFSFGLLCFIALFSATSSNGQQIPTHLLNNMSVRSIGPAVTSGRVTSIDAIDEPQGPVYVGTASGGVWKSESGTLTWQPLFDEQEVIGIGAVKIAPSNHDVVWVGTGEGNPRNSQTSGKGIYKSLDAGNTWVKMGLESTKVIHRICIDRNNEDVVYAGAGGSPWGPNADRGVFKTSDGGENWEKVLFVNDSVGCADLVMDPSNSNKLFAAMWQYQRQPWYFNSGGAGSGLYRTLDGGKTWRLLSEDDGLPKGPLGRIGIAIAPSNSKVVYAMIESEKTGLYRSVDGGVKWKLVTTDHVDDRPFYYNEFYVDPSNENHLIYLHSTVSESIDGGKTWNTILPYWGVHPDHHAFWWSQSNPSFMMEGNDGGMNVSYDGGRNWRFVENLPLGQFYHINYDMETPYNVYGGMQDNGSWKGPGYVWHSSGITESDWSEVLFGDGFDVVPRRDNSRYVYAMSQGGEVNHIDTETGNMYSCQPIADDSTKLRFNWNSAIFENETGLYFGSQFLHYSTDHGKSWSKISPDLTSNDTTKLIAHKSGGLTIDATSAENYCTIISISASQNDIWVGTDDGNLQHSTDHGSTWKNVSSQIKGFPKNAWIPFILHGAKDEIFVVVNNYRMNDWNAYLYHSTDNGKTWKNLTEKNKVAGHCLSIAQDTEERNLLFLGTEHGLYVSIDHGLSWTKWSKNYPSVATQDLKIHPREGDLIIGTFGRAAYIIDDISPLRMLAKNPHVFDNQLTAINAQSNCNAVFKRADGKRFPADAEFAGNNKPTGAGLAYYFNYPKEKSKEKPKVKVSILGEHHDTLRWFISEPDSGLNLLHWYGETNGEPWPARKRRDRDDSPPGTGYGVKSGKYVVYYEFKESKDSTFVEIKSDPRLKFNEEFYEAAQKNWEVFTKEMNKLVALQENIKTMRESVSIAESAWKYVEDSSKKELFAEADSLMKVLSSLEDEIYGDENQKGIHDNSHTVMSKWWAVSGFIGDEYSEHQVAFDLAFDIAFKQQTVLITKYQNLVNDSWNDWLTRASNVQPILGKALRPLD
ncbi:MAG: hypothetical protein R2809_12065 [Flavobacteriales bacterium]